MKAATENISINEFVRRTASQAGMAILLACVILYSELTSRDPTGNLRFAFLAFAYCAALTAILMFITKRVTFSLPATPAVALSLVAVSKTKFVYLRNALAPHDLYFHFREWSELHFFIMHYSKLFWTGSFILTAGMLALVLIWRIDASKAPRTASAALLIASLVTAEYLARQHSAASVYWTAAFDDRHISGFILASRTFTQMLREPLTLPTSKAALSSSQNIITPHKESSSKPNIIVVLHESSVDPGIYFNSERHKVPASFFASGDAQRRRLMVHTFGGRTWISEYGFLLGIDVSYFGERKGFLGILGTDAFKNTFPQELKRLGYTTIANYPSPSSFMNTKRFYANIGFDTVYEAADIGIFIKPSSIGRPRDRVYYDFLLKDLQLRKASSEKQGPLFYFLWTTATHAPYDKTEFPSERSDEAVEGDIFVEYARRQRIAADDLKWLEDRLQKQFPNEKFLVAGFGDHHPYITWFHYNRNSWPMMHPIGTSEGEYITYYRINGVNFDPFYSGLSPLVDIGFLGETILEAAGLPVSPSFQIRRNLRKRCDGRWATCADQSAVLDANTALSNGSTSILRAK